MFFKFKSREKLYFEDAFLSEVLRIIRLKLLSFYNKAIIFTASELPDSSFFNIFNIQS